MRIHFKTECWMDEILDGEAKDWYDSPCEPCEHCKYHDTCEYLELGCRGCSGRTDGPCDNRAAKEDPEYGIKWAAVLKKVKESLCPLRVDYIGNGEFSFTETDIEENRST